MWIIGKHLAKDEQTLADCGIKATGTLIYLYLKSPEHVGVKEYGDTRRDQEVQTEEEETNFLQSMEFRNAADLRAAAQQYGFVCSYFLDDFVAVIGRRHGGTCAWRLKSGNPNPIALKCEVPYVKEETLVECPEKSKLSSYNWLLPQYLATRLP